jgi:acetyltransferase-like isoleucine patch superfamily enzyme
VKRLKGHSCVSQPPGLCRFGVETVVGDRVRLGTGIYVQPPVELGDDMQVAPGSVTIASGR